MLLNVMLKMLIKTVGGPLEFTNLNLSVSESRRKGAAPGLIVHLFHYRPCKDNKPNVELWFQTQVELREST